ncbi:hypothetical protein BDV19DRAFT_383878 [Aspergillus venezuelensis]
MSDCHRLPFINETFDLAAGSTSDGLASLLPASYGDALVSPTGNINLWSPADAITTFVQLDLSVERLTRVQSYLSFAKDVTPPQPLSTVISLGRKIILDENATMHLVYSGRNNIHLKPLLRYLLDSRFWSKYLLCGEEESPGCTCTGQDTCPRRALYKDALGLLYSYLTLIRYESDFAIAQSHSLLPPDLTWETWRRISQQTLQNNIITSQTINPRYTLGALYLSRLNIIYALVYGDILRGYSGQYRSIIELFVENIAPISAMTIYIALVLTAMQVGLATDGLSENRAFQNASYGFTVFAIVAPLQNEVRSRLHNRLDLCTSSRKGRRQPRRDQNSYTLGEISGHNVVVACLPAGSYGTTSAAVVAANMRTTFPTILIGLMVGIGGGFPLAAADIRLGDVVVSQPQGQYPGVVQYDFGKAISSGHFQRTGTLDRPPLELLTALATVQATHIN